MGEPVDTELRPAIAQSWQRSDVVGLPPDSTLDHLVPIDVDPQSSLLAAASAVLEELDEQLRETRYGDPARGPRVPRRAPRLRRLPPHGRARRPADRPRHQPGRGGRRHQRPRHRDGDPRGHRDQRRGALRRALQAVLLLRPADPAPVVAAHRGRPRHHRDLRRREPAAAGLVARAVADIERRLLDGSRASERRLLDAFQAASSVRQRAVVAAGEDLVLSNQAASTC